MEEPTLSESKEKKFINNKLALKILFIGFLIVLLLIPISMIENLISERSDTASKAMNEVEEKWSRSQQVTGPFLIIPYQVIYENDKKMVERDIRYLYILPESLQINGNVKTEELKRGLYDIIVYHTPLNFTGKFSFASLSEENISAQDMLLSEARLVIGITDLHGIPQQVQGSWNKKNLAFNPGVNNVLTSSGISSPVQLSLEELSEDISFSISMNIKGSESITFAPLGKTTHVTLESDCITPSFCGAFLPEKREISESGFSADWTVLHLNRNYPQIFRDGTWRESIQNSIFGVNLLLPVDQYQKSMRSVKYAFLIIILSFVVCFFTEIMHRRNINPIQYLLIGLALCLFYTLLIAISEHLNFSLSYALASLMTIALLTLYLGGILKIWKTAITIGALLSLLYIYIFILIQMEIYALLVGSIGLFIILAIIMYCSQKINWDEPKIKNRE